MLGLFALIGRMLINFVREFGEIIILSFKIGKYFPRAIKDRKLVIEQMAIVGADSLPLVILIGSFTGAIAALQATNLFDKFNLVGIPSRLLVHLLPLWYLPNLLLCLLH